MEAINNEDQFQTGLTEQDEIIKYLDSYKNNNQNDKYLNVLLFYYMILSPEICQKYKINKIKTEKEMLFDIINDLIDKFGDVNKNKECKKTDKDLFNYLDLILNKPAKDELKNFTLEEIPSRWNTIYSKIIHLENETNNELIYYNQTNDLLVNIRQNKRPFEIIYFLNEFMKLFNKFKYKKDLDQIPVNIRLFLLLGLSNCEYIDYNNGFLLDFIKIIDMENLSDVEKYIKYILNPKYIYHGILQKVIIKFVNSKLAYSAFIKIFNSEIPKDLKEEIFTNNITKYICFFPFSSYDNTERTLRRISMILINTCKDKKFASFKNNKLNILLSQFSNIVVRKHIFGHEHQHLSGGLLYFKKKTKRISIPPHNIREGIVAYDENSEVRGVRGEIFELLSYGKVFKVYSIFDLIFMADETNDNLNIDEHLKKYKEFRIKKKSLLEELKNFPKEQTLSDMVNEIYSELIKDQESCEKLNKNPYIAYKDEELSNNEDNNNSEGNKNTEENNIEDYINILENSENLITPEICPFSTSKVIYTRMKQK